MSLAIINSDQRHECVKTPIMQDLKDVSEHHALSIFRVKRMMLGRGHRYGHGV
jgi:hypothetical protein